MARVASKVPAKCHPERMQYALGECSNCYQKRRREENLEGTRKKRRDYVRRNPEMARGWYLKARKKALEANPEVFNDRTRKWRLANPDKHRETQKKSHLKVKFNLTPLEFENMQSQQSGCCLICWRKKYLSKSENET